MSYEAKKIVRLGEEVVCLSGGGYEALLVPQLGCNCASLVHLATGAQLMRSPESVQELRENPNVYGTPLLFPPNRIKDGTYTYQGYTYNLPINERHGHHMHGFISETEFEVVSLQADDACAQACFRYQSTLEKPYLAEFPHQFTIELTATLNEKGITQQLKITNDGEREMPTGTGFHTAFAAPFMPEGREEDIRLALTCNKALWYDERIIPTGEVSYDDPLLLKLKGEGVTPCEAPISIHLDQTGGKAWLRDLGQGYQIEYTVDDKFLYWMLWNMDAEHRFMCPEPQTWMIDAPNRPVPAEESGLRGLKKGESLEVQTNICLSKIGE